MNLVEIVCYSTLTQSNVMVAGVANVRASVAYSSESFLWLSVCPACMCPLQYVSCTLCDVTLCPLQLVEVAGCNMWVMEETDGLSSDPRQTGHLRQKVHAQQSPASSLERSAVSPRMTGWLL